MEAFLQQGDQEVDGHSDVLSELVFSHAFITDGYVKAGNLLELEPNACTGIVNLVLERLGMRDDLRESANSVKNGSQNLGDLLDKAVSGQEKMVFFGPVFDGLLLLVEFFQSIKIDGVNIELLSFGLFEMLGVSNEANLELWSGDVRKSDSSCKTLIFGWVVVLKTNLKLDSLLELPLLAALKHLFDAGSDHIPGNFGTKMT